MSWRFSISRNRVACLIIRMAMPLLLPILSFNCESLYSDSMDPVNNFPLPALIKPFYAKGILDKRFGNNGISKSNDFGIDESCGYSMVVDNSGKIYVAGSMKNEILNNDLVLWRYNSNGLPDTTFGDNGFIRAADPLMEGDSWGDLAVSGMTIDNEGMLYIVSSSLVRYDDAGSYSMLVWKYDTAIKNNRILDVFARFDFSEYGNYSNVLGNKIKTDNKGRVVVVGIAMSYMSIWRYNKNGSLDNDFGINGITFGLGLEEYPNYVGNIGWGIAFDNKGRILITGSLDVSTTRIVPSDIMLTWRFNENGTPDTNFGQNGFILHDGVVRNNEPGGLDCGYAIINDIQGRIIVLGFSDDINNIERLVLICYNEKGNLDSSFGNNGVAIINDNNSIPYDKFGLLHSMTLDSRGKILITGQYSDGMVIWRYNTDGTPDLSFGSNGATIYRCDHIVDNITYGNLITTDKHGRIYVVGGSGYDKQQMTLWRYK